MPRRFSALILLSLTLFFSLPSFVFAQDNYGLDSTAGAAGIPTAKNVTTILGDVIGTALSLVSVLFFGLMLYAGIKWMLARGDEGESTKALDTIVAAIIGLVIVLASYAITTFVFKSVGGGGDSKNKGEGSCQVYHGYHLNDDCLKISKENCGKDNATWCTLKADKCVYTVESKTEYEEMVINCPKTKEEKDCNAIKRCEWK